MYKKQLSLQKILCLIAIGVSAAVFIYSLGLVTDLYDALYATMPNPNNLSYTEVPGSYVYYEIQDFNHALMLGAIGMILLSVMLFITNTHSRRRYYIGNYIATGLYAAAAIALSVWGHIEMEYYKAQFLKVDFEALREFAEFWDTLYTDSTFWFDAHYVLFGLLLASALLLVLNALFKTLLMAMEARLLRNKVKPVDEETRLKRDRMRFIKNSLSANLVIFAIVFDVLYFISIYGSNVGNYYYKYIIGISVVYNLVFMLAAFLSSEGVKNYKKSYSWLLLLLGAGQVARIFILPLDAHSSTVRIGRDMVQVMSDGQFITLVVFLGASAACLFAAAVTAFIRCRALEAHKKTLAQKAD